MPPTIVKPRKANRERIWKRSLAIRFTSPEEREAWWDREVAWEEWISGWGRMWRYIGMHEAIRRGA